MIFKFQLLRYIYIYIIFYKMGYNFHIEYKLLSTNPIIIYENEFYYQNEEDFDNDDNDDDDDDDDNDNDDEFDEDDLNRFYNDPEYLEYINEYNNEF